MLTGESLPVEKKIGDQVIGSTLNKMGMIHFEATKVGKETALAQIVKLVEEAQGSKAPIQKLADQVSAVFVPIVILLAASYFSGLVFYSSDHAWARTGPSNPSTDKHGFCTGDCLPLRNGSGNPNRSNGWHRQEC